MKRLQILALCLLALGAFPAHALEPSRDLVSEEKILRLQAMHDRADERILKNDFEGAIAIYDEILLEEPDDETAYTGMGQCQLILGDFRRAKDSYQNALHINPDNETAKLGLQRIEDPDSMNFTDTRTEKSPAPEEPEIQADSAPAPAAEPGAFEPPPARQAAGQEKNGGFASPTKMPASVEIPIMEMPMRQQEEANSRVSNDAELGAKKTMAPYSVDIPEPVRNLTRGHKIQAALKNAGFYNGPIDGVIGPATRRATRQFQEEYDLAVDGKVGPKTWELLQPFLHPYGLKEDVLKKSAREGH